MFLLAVTFRPFSALLKPGRGGGVPQGYSGRSVKLIAWLYLVNSLQVSCGMYCCPNYAPYLHYVLLWQHHSIVSYQLQCKELQDCVRISSRNGWYLSPIWQCQKPFYRNFFWSSSHFPVVVQAVASQLLVECSKQYGGWYMGTAWARHGHGMGTAWARHGMCELALKG